MANANLDKVLAALEAVLRAQLALQESLLGLAQRKRVALAGADHAGLVGLCKEENALVQRLGDLEKQRLALAANLTLLLVPGAAAPMRLPELADRIAEPVRGRLLVLRQQLRGRMEEVRRELGVARQATESLLRHMQGLIQSIGGAVSGVSTYGRAGARPRLATAVSTFSATA